MWTERKRLVGLLAASLLLNVFLVGLFVGRGVALHKPPGPPPTGPLVPDRQVAALPDDQKKLFRDAMKAHREVIQAARRRHRAARDKIEADIAAPVFDRANVTADFDTLHQTNRDIDQAVGDALVDALGSLEPASRAALVTPGAATSQPPAKGP